MFPNANVHICAGNGWAAAGMLRVLGTIKHSDYANTLSNEQNDLVTWIKEIHTGIYPHLVRAPRPLPPTSH